MNSDKQSTNQQKKKTYRPRIARNLNQTPYKHITVIIPIPVNKGAFSLWQIKAARALDPKEIIEKISTPVMGST